MDEVAVEHFNLGETMKAAYTVKEQYPWLTVDVERDSLHSCKLVARTVRADEGHGSYIRVGSIDVSLFYVVRTEAELAELMADAALVDAALCDDMRKRAEDNRAAHELRDEATAFDISGHPMREPDDQMEYLGG